MYIMSREFSTPSSPVRLGAPRWTAVSFRCWLYAVSCQLLSPCPIMGREFSTPPPAGHSMFSLPRLFVRCATLLHPSHPSFVFMHLRTAQFPSLLFSNLYNSGGC